MGLAPMDHLDHPSKIIWKSRRLWFKSKENRQRSVDIYAVSKPAHWWQTYSPFCAGAWIAVILLAERSFGVTVRSNGVKYSFTIDEIVSASGTNPHLGEDLPRAQ